MPTQTMKNGTERNQKMTGKSGACALTMTTKTCDEQNEQHDAPVQRQPRFCTIDVTGFQGGLGMTIHVGTEQLKQFSCVSSAVLQIGDDTIEVMGDSHANLHWINKQTNANLDNGVNGHPVSHRKKNSKQHEVIVDLDGDKSILMKTFEKFVRERHRKSMDFQRWVKIINNPALSIGSTSTEDKTSLLSLLAAVTGTVLIAQYFSSKQLKIWCHHGACSCHTFTFHFTLKNQQHDRMWVQN